VLCTSFVLLYDNNNNNNRRAGRIRPATACGWAHIVSTIVEGVTVQCPPISIPTLLLARLLYSLHIVFGARLVTLFGVSSSVVVCRRRRRL